MKHFVHIQTDERVAVLEERIAKDAARIAELERMRAQFEQLQEFKGKWIASQVTQYVMHICTIATTYGVIIKSSCECRER